jgi:hypothetical protein
LHGAAALGGVESFPQLKTSAFSAVSGQNQQVWLEMAEFRTGTKAFSAGTSKFQAGTPTFAAGT